MFLFEVVAQTVLLPALCCGILFLACSRAGRADKLGRRRASAIALAGGYLTGHILIIGLPGFPPVGATQWLFPLVLLATVCGLISPSGKRLELVLAVITLTCLLATLLQPMFEYHWSGIETVAWSAGLFVVLLFIWRTLLELARKEEGPLPAVMFLLICVSASVILGLSATSLLSQLGAVLGVGLGVLAILSFRYSIPASGWVWIGFTALVGLVLAGHFFARLSFPNLVLILGSLPAIRVSQVNWVTRRPEWVRWLLTGVALLILLAPALLMSYSSFLEATSYDDY